jgi:hypothetical protein
MSLADLQAAHQPLQNSPYLVRTRLPHRRRVVNDPTSRADPRLAAAIRHGSQVILKIFGAADASLTPQIAHRHHDRQFPARGTALH